MVHSPFPTFKHGKETHLMTPHKPYNLPLALNYLAKLNYNADKPDTPPFVEHILGLKDKFTTAHIFDKRAFIAYLK